MAIPLVSVFGLAHSVQVYDVLPGNTVVHLAVVMGTWDNEKLSCTQGKTQDQARENRRRLETWEDGDPETDTQTQMSPKHDYKSIPRERASCC